MTWQLGLTGLAALALTSVTSAALPPVVDFENFSQNPSEGAPVGDQYWDSHGVRFYDGQPGHNLVLSKVGAPFTAFRGYIGLADFPHPGARVGQHFITDDHQGTGMNPGPFVIEYRWPTDRVSGVFIDVNERESWKAEAFDDAGNSRGSVQVFPTTLPGVALEWSLRSEERVITKVIITFTGVASPGGVTFALDNIGGSTPNCLADRNGDGTVDFADFLAFLSDYVAEKIEADITGDGQIDFQDYLSFLTSYDAGC